MKIIGRTSCKCRGETRLNWSEREVLPVQEKNVEDEERRRWWRRRRREEDDSALEAIESHFIQLKPLPK